LFRDDVSLSATPHLWPTIETAFGQSRFFILLASPEAATSDRVAKELAWWLCNRTVDTLLVALTAGELDWDPAASDFRWAETIPLPRVLRHHFAHEPRWIDLRRFRDSPAPRDTHFLELAANFAAAIHGRPREDLLSEELQQQRRALTLAWSASTLLALLVAVATWQWQVAERERAMAQRNLDAAKQAINGLIADIVQGLGNVEGVRVATLQKVLGRVETTINRVAQDAQGDRDLERSRLQMHLSFGSLFSTAGDIDSARKSAEITLNDARSLLTAEPTVAQNRDNLVAALQKAADIRNRAEDNAGALAAASELLDILKGQGAGAPTVPLIASYYYIGMSNRQLGNSDASLAALGQGIALARQQLQQLPGNWTLSYQLAYLLDEVTTASGRLTQSPSSISLAKSTAFARA
jgi:tetratricopeptide (TPR) repeat protein